MTSLESGPFISTPKSPCICSCFRFTSKLTTKYPVIRQPPCPKLLIPIVALTIILGLYYLSKGYLRSLLSWIEVQNPWLIFVCFIFLFTIVSFPPPFPIGYLILIITSGYLFGFAKGLLTVVLGANLGAGIAHVTIKSMQSKLPLQKLLKNDTGKAILRVIGGPRAFKIVLLARLTPIPFGLQNTIFGVSNVHPKDYYSATLIGLFPAQAINVYIGSSLRSMHDVLNNHSTAMTSYAIFAVQVCIGLILMVWVVHKARKELSDALLVEIDNNFKVIVEVQ
ncbi:transmembrane protein 64 [Bradysia coprophila]|uniref:transmembrane protein 64 n=1 Tax=Bradysia coprophila TaxID=38358 RepID=UPI00187D94F6|nr:transmembrane protein 64 [Bradysia coprophila]